MVSTFTLIVRIIVVAVVFVVMWPFIKPIFQNGFNGKGINLGLSSFADSITQRPR